MSRNRVAPSDIEEFNFDSTDDEGESKFVGNQSVASIRGLPEGETQGEAQGETKTLSVREKRRLQQNATSNSNRNNAVARGTSNARVGRLSHHGITSPQQREKRRQRNVEKGGDAAPVPTITVAHASEDKDTDVRAARRKRAAAAAAANSAYDLPGDADNKQNNGGSGDESGNDDGSNTKDAAKAKKRRLSKKHFGMKEQLGIKGALKAVGAWIKTEATRKRANPVWSRRIKVIEGRFGAGIASYFTFIRLVLEINVYLMLVTMFFVVIPFSTHHSSEVQVVQFDPMYVPNNTCQWYNAAYLVATEVAAAEAVTDAGAGAAGEAEQTLNNATMSNATLGVLSTTCPTGHARGITACIDGAMLTNCTYKGTFEFTSLLNGDTSVGVSPMFYGGYPNKLYDDTGEVVVYRMDLAFILTPLFLMSSVLLFLFFSVFRSWRNSGSSMVSSDNKMPFALFSLASYDFSVNTKEGVENLRLGISRAMTEGLYDMYVNEDGGVTKKLTTKQLIARIIGWTLYMGIMVGSIYAIFQLVTWSNNRKREAALDETKPLNIYEQYALSAALAALNSILPFVFKAFAYVEDYVNKATEIKIEIARTFIIRMIGVYAILFGFISGGETHMSDPHLPPFPMVDNGTVATSFQDPLPLYTMDQTFCVGTNIGQEFYKLVLVDMLFVVFSEIVLYFVIMCITKDTQDLDIAQAVIMICYRQGLIWVGMFFCPILAWIGALAAFLSFYTYYLIVVKTCHPPKKSLGAASTRTVFLFFMTMTLLVATAPVLYILRIYDPNCGPYAAPKYTSAFSGLHMWAQEDSATYKHASLFLDVVQDPLVLWVLVLGQGIFINYTRENLSVAKFKQKDLQDEIAQVHAEAREMNGQHLSDDHHRSDDIDL